MSQSPKAKDWPTNRQVKNDACHCLRHSNANYICRICLDHSKIKCKTTEIKCNKCPNAYHIKCLPTSKQTRNTWNECSELEIEGISCVSNTDPQRIQMGEIKPIKNINKETQQLRNDYRNNAKLAEFEPIAYYENVWINNVLFEHEDFVEVRTDKNGICVAKIINIFLDKNKAAQLVIEFYWTADEFETELRNKYGQNDRLIFEETCGWCVQSVCIETINGKVLIVASEKECIDLRQKLQNLYAKNVQTKEDSRECTDSLKNEFEYIYTNIYAMSKDGYEGVKNIMSIDHNKNKLKQYSNHKYKNAKKRKRANSSDEAYGPVGPKRKKRRTTNYNKNYNKNKNKNKNSKMPMSDESESESESEDNQRNKNRNNKKNKVKPLLIIIDDSDNSSDNNNKTSNTNTAQMIEMSSGSSDLPILRNKCANEESNQLSSSSEHSNEYLHLEMNANEPSMNPINANRVAPFGGNQSGHFVEISSSENEECGNKLENEIECDPIDSGESTQRKAMKVAQLAQELHNQQKRDQTIKQTSEREILRELQNIKK